MGILDAAVANGYVGVSGWLLSISGWSGRKGSKRELDFLRFHIFLGKFCEYSGDEIRPRFLRNLKITNRRTHSVAQSIPVIRSSLTRQRGCVPQKSPRVLLEETALSPPFQDSL